MEISIADQIALDDALVAPADRLKIGKCNLRLSSDVTSKEATLQIPGSLLFVLSDLSDFKTITKAHSREWSIQRHSLISATNNRLGHSGEIRKITDVNVNKLHQPWRSFAAIINKCLSGKPSYDSLRLSQAQILWGTIPPKTKGSKKKANTDTTTKQKPPTAPKEKKEKKSGKGKQKTTELETISEAVLTEAEQLKIITKRSRKETHSSHASGSGADEGTGVTTPGDSRFTDYDSEDDISWKSSDDDQDDEKAQDDEDADKNDVNETTQDDEDDDEHDDDEKAQDDDDEEQTESEDDDEEDSNNEIKGTNVEGAKSGEDATYEEDQGNKAVEDTFQILMEEMIVSVSSGFVSNMLNPKPDTGVDDIFGTRHNDATSLIVTLPMKFDRIREELILQISFPDSVDERNEEKFIMDSQKRKSPKEANTSHAVAANLSELELKKILIDKMEANNSINRSDIQRQLYKALVDAYEADKILLDTYGDTVTIKRPRDGADDDQEPSAGTDRGSKRRRSGKEPASTSAPSETTTTTAGKTTTTGSKTHKQSASQSAPVEETMQTTDVFEAPAHQEFETGVHDEQAEEESVPAVHESVQPWLSNLAQRQDPRESFDELTDNTFDFSAFVMNRLNVQTLTPELLAGPTFELMKGTCKSLTELEYFCEEVYKATTENIGLDHPEGRQYPHDMRRNLTTAADYGHIKWIEDLVPNSMWSQMIVKYDKFALWGISHWGKKRRQFYAFATTRESARDVYSKRRIIAVTKVEIVEWQNYKHLDWITVRRDDDVLYKFKEGDFP
ncbi:hypothetical protein Tco_0656848 [Tanacetum coccineum]|uniref:Uncharacterized protein n=1 Tax=Tanacetum coccineum TaxID=301880 RepID=A0ABQ4X9W4_9ASTR